MTAWGEIFYKVLSFHFNKIYTFTGVFNATEWTNQHYATYKKVGKRIIYFQPLMAKENSSYYQVPKIYKKQIFHKLYLEKQPNHPSVFCTGPAEHWVPQYGDPTETKYSTANYLQYMLQHICWFLQTLDPLTNANAHMQTNLLIIGSDERLHSSF